MVLCIFMEYLGGARAQWTFSFLLLSCLVDCQMYSIAHTSTDKYRMHWNLCSVSSKRDSIALLERKLYHNETVKAVRIPMQDDAFTRRSNLVTIT